MATNRGLLATSSPLLSGRCFPELDSLGLQDGALEDLPQDAWEFARVHTHKPAPGTKTPLETVGVRVRVCV